MARPGPWLLLAAFGCSVLALTPGCADPNPTFIFDAAVGAAGRDGSTVDTARPDLAPPTPDASDGGAAGAGP